MTTSRPLQDPNLAADNQRPAQRRLTGPLPTRPVLQHMPVKTLSLQKSPAQELTSQ